METMKHSCNYCDDPVYDFQEIYHKGCAEIQLEEKIDRLKKQIKNLKAMLKN